MPKHSVPTMPSTVSPRPRWASAVPKTERGRPAKRRSMMAGRHIAEAGLDGKIGERAADQPEREADAESGEHRRAVDEQAGDQHRQQGSGEGRHQALGDGKRSPRFQASSGPNGTTTSSGTISGPKVRLKNGAPTEILSPDSASSASG